MVQGYFNQHQNEFDEKLFTIQDGSNGTSHTL
jgi:hypothetical protein